jgi:hypothetical protein
VKHEQRGFWQAGRVVDDDVAPTRPVRLVLACLLALLLVDVIITATLHGQPVPSFETLDDAEDVRAVLERAAADPEPWLLIGDSVLVGDVMAGSVQGWQQQRVLDHLRHQRALDSKATFHQVALDGLLPVDILRIVTELDRIDPAGRVPVVIELSPRYASRHHAESAACTRPWLCELGVPLFADDGLDWAAFAAMTGRAALRMISDYLPVARHRRHLGLGFDLANTPEIADSQRPAAAADPLEARARLLEHYADPALSEDASVQLAALQETLARINAAGRRAVLFTTPIEDLFLAEASHGDDQGALIARWAELVDTPRSTATLVNLDHPLFASPLFLDHCHMGPEGNRLLAQNLLHELSLGLAHVPARTEIVNPEGPDATLVARIAPGSSDGASWQAAFDHPRGLAVQRGGRRVVVADTGNHCLRELRGNLQTVRTVAGRPGELGSVGGPGAQARLDGPRTPCFLGDDVYFTTQDGRTLQRLAADYVSTVQPGAGPQWTKITQIRAANGQLYLLDNDTRILRLDPKRGRSSVVVSRSGKLTIRAFDVTPDGRLFVADSKGRIWRSAAARMATLGGAGAELVFANKSALALPDDIGAFFPFGFDEVKLHNVVDLQWVERYDSLLVADDVPLAGSDDNKYVSERIQLRLLSLTDLLVFPWLKPLAFGGGHILYNQNSSSLVSNIHEGSLALEQDSASTFYLEHGRSRLVRFGDGLFGAALIGNTNSKRVFNRTREFFGPFSGEATLARFRPDRYADRRIERLPRSGPYLGVLVGSSMIGGSDMVGGYSTGRRIEELLQDALGYRDRIRFDLIVRSYSGNLFRDSANALQALVDSSVLPDVMLVELRGEGHVFGDSPTDGSVLESLRRMEAAAARADALLVFIDVTAMVSRRRDGLRTGAPKTVKRFQLIRDAGHPVLDPGDAMLADYLRISPWGSPPFARNHTSPWGIDASAERFAALLYPRLVRHLQGRLPSRLRAAKEELPAGQPIGAVLAELARADTKLIQVPAGALQRTYTRGHLELFVDLAKLGDAGRQQSLELVALSCIAAQVGRNPGNAKANRVTVRLAEFANYDEYGNAALEGATIRFERSFNAKQLRAFSRSTLAADK